MTRLEQVSTRITGILRELFDEYEGPVDRHLSARGVPQWDSLGHVQLLVAVEQAFGVRFTTAEIRDLQTLGDLIDLVAHKTAC